MIKLFKKSIHFAQTVCREGFQLSLAHFNTFALNYNFNKLKRNRSLSNAITITIKNREKRNSLNQIIFDQNEDQDLSEYNNLKIFKSNQEIISRCQNGKWNPPLIDCVPKDCNVPFRLHTLFVKSRVDNLLIPYNLLQKETEETTVVLQPGEALSHGKIARMICLRGFLVVGNNLVECFQGRIVRDVGKCVPKNCTLPKYSYFASNMTILEHGKSSLLYCEGHSTALIVSCSFGQFNPTPNCRNNELSYCVSPKKDGNIPALVFHVTNHKNNLKLNSVNLPAQEILYLDRFQSAYPNGTIIRFKCEDFKTNINNERYKFNDYKQQQAGATQCINGKWHSSLLPCVLFDKNHSFTIGHSTNSSHYLKIINRNRDGTHCFEPKFNSTYMIQNLDDIASNVNNNNNNNSLTSNVISYPHGTFLLIKCKHFDTRGKVEHWRCRRGKWERKNRIECFSEIGMCQYKIDLQSRVNVFYKQGRDFVLFNQKFPHNSELIFTCTNNYMEQMRGISKSVCVNGEWVPRTPHCLPLDLTHNQIESPPVHFIVENGVYAISIEGHLIVNQSATIKLFCFYPKHMGKPKWV